MNTETQQPKQSLASFAMMLFAIGALVAAIGTTRADLGWLPYMYGEWKPVNAIVHGHANLHISKSSHEWVYEPRMYYGYSVERLPYQGTTFHMPPEYRAHHDLEASMKVFAAYPIGSTAPIFYRVDRPDLSFGTRDRRGYFIELCFYWSIAMLLFVWGIFAMRAHVRSRRQGRLLAPRKNS